MTPRRSTRLRGDGGAAIVELALVLPVLATLAMGVLEFGLAWRVGTNVDRAAAAGGRSGSSLADNRWADYQLLQVVNSTLSATSGELKRVIVYKADDADGEVPGGCLAINPAGTSAKGIAGLCNVYSAEQAASTSFAGWGGATSCASGAWDGAWCPTSRDRNRSGGSDYLGVYVEVEKEAVTGMFLDEFTIERSAVFLLEPENVGDD